MSYSSVPLSRATAAGEGFDPTFASRYAQWRSQRALRALQRYSGLDQRLVEMQRGRRFVRRTLGEVASAQLAAWRTAAELRALDSRLLQDVEIPREMIGPMATVSAFGWPFHDGLPAEEPAQGRIAWSRVRRTVLPTRTELDDEYLAGSADLYDLESRMAEIDRRKVKPLHAA